MKKIKRSSKSQIDRMTESEKKEHYKRAVEYYGNLDDQLRGFRAKGILHPLLWLVTYVFPIRVVKLNAIDWTDANKPVIFSANHNNANDFPSLARAIKRHFFILADYTLINDRIVNLANTLNGCIYVDRKSKKSTANAFRQSIEGVKKRYNMVIFPESTWNLTRSLPILPRYWGDVKIAQETGCPIIPTVMVYCKRICLIKFGEKIYVSKEDSVDEKDKEVHNAMVNLRADIEASPEYLKYHKPMEYEDWIRKNIESYQHFDVDYEMSCIRKDDTLPKDELEEIIRIGKEMRPVDEIRKKLKYARINYRYEEE